MFLIKLSSSIYVERIVKWRFRRNSELFLICVMASTVSTTTDRALASSQSNSEFRALAINCAPSVPWQTLYAIAVTESDLNPFALHDNTTGITVMPPNKQYALADANLWIGRGDSVDIGLMQINSANLSALSMRAGDALDPCNSLAAGAAILQAAYHGMASTDEEVSLLLALSRYNTGSPVKGILNGYARRVMTNVGAVVPGISSYSSVQDSELDSGAPPSWDISANGEYAQVHGATWLVPLVTASDDRNEIARPKISRPNNSLTVVEAQTEHAPVNP